MAFAVLILTSRNLLVILNIYLYLSSLSRDASHAAPASLGYRTLYASQLMSNPSMKEYSHLHNPRHKPLSSNLTLIRGIHIAMNFSISLTLNLYQMTSPLTLVPFATSQYPNLMYVD